MVAALTSQDSALKVGRVKGVILGIPAQERHKAFWVRQQGKVTHFPEGRKLPPACLDICKSTVAEESPPCITVLPYFSLSSSLPPPPPPVGRQSSRSEPKGTKFWPQAGAGQPSWRNKLKVTKDKNFQMRFLPTSCNSMWSTTANPVKINWMFAIAFSRRP